MPREILDKQIKSLENEILQLGSRVEKATLEAVDALKKHDVARATKIQADDQQINEKRYALENAILITIATQQPLARDLRLLAAMLEVGNELERMGDYAKGIAKIAIRRGQVEFCYPSQELDKMAKLAVAQLHRALTAFVKEDYKAAVLIPKGDDEIDDLYNKVFRLLIDCMIKDPKIIDHASLLLWVAHNLERLGDRVTNICERIIFITTGEMMEMDSSEGNEPDNEGE
jgi:phosphate transport system protein